MTATAKALALTMAAMMLIGCGVARGTPQTAYVAPRGPFLPLPEHRRIPFPAATPGPSAAPTMAVPDPTIPPLVVSPVIQARATWYCGSTCTRGYPSGLYAAISPDLRYLGPYLVVSYNGRSVAVTVIDCLCSRMGGIDLYAAAFSQLAPLSRGVLSVTISR